MPPKQALEGLPTIGTETQHPRDSTMETTSVVPTPSGVSASAMLTNLLPMASHSLTLPMGGDIYVGDSLPPVPAKLATKIRKGEFIDMGELLPEFWSNHKDEEADKAQQRQRRSCKVTDIFTWLQLVRECPCTR